MGVGISGGGHVGPVRQGARPGPSWPGGGPPGVFSVLDILKYSSKNHISITGHLENFYFWGIFYCKNNSENRQKILILLYLI